MQFTCTHTNNIPDFTSALKACEKFRIPAILCRNDGNDSQRGKNYWMVKRLKQLNARQ